MKRFLSSFKHNFSHYMIALPAINLFVQIPIPTIQIWVAVRNIIIEFAVVKIAFVYFSLILQICVQLQPF